MSQFNLKSRSTKLVAVGGLLALGGGLVAGGCGGPDYTILSNFCVALAEADCSQAIVEACYGSTDETIDADTTSCINARSELQNCDPGNLPYHADFADGCLAAHQQVYAQATLQESDFQALAQACLPVFNNGGEMGAPCTGDVDCDVGNGLACVVHQGPTGTCQIPITVEGGESCAGPTAQCDTGFYCDSTAHCVSDPFNGQACSMDIPCGTGLRCEQMACESQLPDGSACETDTDCVGGFCLATAGTTGAGICSATYTFSITSTSCAAFR